MKRPYLSYASFLHCPSRKQQKRISNLETQYHNATAAMANPLRAKGLPEAGNDVWIVVHCASNEAARSHVLGATIRCFR
jgi:hypothetical protein